jgi:hypothetical protein
MLLNIIFNTVNQSENFAAFQVSETIEDNESLEFLIQLINA